MKNPIRLPADLSDRLEALVKRTPQTLDINVPIDPDKTIPAAVLMPLFFNEDRWNLLYTRRTETLTSHRGQVSFPGGAWEAVDGDLFQTALREACEEVGIQPGDVRIIGQLPAMLLVSYFQVTPVVGVIPWPYALKASADEVAQIFTVPLDWLTDPLNLTYSEVEYEGKIYHIPFFKLYAGQTIWGATAMMTLEFLKLLE